ncbi:MAG: hypothetical protein V4753_05645 [Pseudomonadota bacterium]
MSAADIFPLFFNSNGLPAGVREPSTIPSRGVAQGQAGVTIEAAHGAGRLCLPTA